jgi:methionyl-tRNA formyltransferase
LGIIRKIILFSDDYGLPQLMRHIPHDVVSGIIGATIRSQQHQTLRALALTQEVPFLIQPRKDSSEYQMFVEHVRLLAPDLIIVNSYSMLLPREILSIPVFGCINIHAALLPQYRGANPIQWALLNDEKETGVTMHYMNEDFDTGDIIAQKRVPILDEDTWINILHRISKSTDEMLEIEIPRIMSGTNSRTPQRTDLARHWRRRRPEDGRFDWTWRARDIYNLIRALVKPHPGAFYFNERGEKIIIDSFMSLNEIKKLQNAYIGHVIE